MPATKRVWVRETFTDSSRAVREQGTSIEYPIETDIDKEYLDILYRNGLVTDDETKPAKKSEPYADDATVDTTKFVAGPPEVSETTSSKKS